MPGTHSQNAHPGHATRRPPARRGERSPPLQLVDGEWTGRYRVRAGNLPITDDRGESRNSVPDYAAAIVDALENGRFVGERFTAAY